MVVRTGGQAIPITVPHERSFLFEHFGCSSGAEVKWALRSSGYGQGMRETTDFGINDNGAINQDFH